MKAMKKSYKPKSMKDLEIEVLRILKSSPGLRCGLIGEKLFPEVEHYRGSAPFARIAGKVVRGLQRKGLVEVKIRNGKFGWFLSREEG